MTYIFLFKLDISCWRIVMPWFHVPPISHEHYTSWEFDKHWILVTENRESVSMYEVCPEVSSHIIWKIEVFIEEDTRYMKHCTYNNDTSVPFKVGTLKPHTVLPIAFSFPDVFSWILSMVWNLFPFKGDFSFGKRQKSQGAKSGL